jgi:pyruvate dehydrogenase complex dehydrogenase (E1) component
MFKPHNGHGYKCGCECHHCECGPGVFARQFITREERLEQLKEYRDQLKQELKGVEEHIQELAGNGCK